MKLYFFFIVIIAVLSLLIFAYMRNKQANRTDSKRQKLEERSEEIMELIKGNNPQQTNIN